MSEQRLIDAFGVQRQLNMSYHGCGLDGFSLGFRKALGLAIQTVENAPTIDPVRHGKWEDYDGVIRINCSNCGKVYFNTTILEVGKCNFCPNCGAKMDGE